MFNVILHCLLQNRGYACRQKCEQTSTLSWPGCPLDFGFSKWIAVNSIIKNVYFFENTTTYKYPNILQTFFINCFQVHVSIGSIHINNKNNNKIQHFVLHTTLLQPFEIFFKSRKLNVTRCFRCLLFLK